MTPKPILDQLREAAGQLAESDLPSPEELRSVVGALGQRLEAFEQKVLDGLGVDSKPAAPAPAEDAAKAAQLQAAQAELEAAQARVAELTGAGESGSSASTG